MRKMAEGTSPAGADHLLFAAARVNEAKGDHAAALGVLEALWVQMARTRYLFGARRHAPYTVALAMRLGRVDLAKEIADVMEDAARRSPARSAAAAARQCRGLVDGDPAALMEAVALFRDAPIPVLRMRACEDAATALVTVDDQAGAIALLDEAVSIAIDLGATGDRSRIDASLRALGVRRRRAQTARPKTGWESLTRMECQVADLVGDGLTNPEIGARLYISRRTVETHLAHIFAKCGLVNRAQVAAEVAKRRLEGPAR
jgi:DNA-binding CsgD family transcriptional regulator